MRAPSGPARARLVHLQGVGVDHRQSAVRRAREVRQQGEEAGVGLHGDHPRAGLEQGPGQPAGSRSDLDHRLALEGPGQPGDLAADVEVEEEVLAEALVGGQAGGAQGVAQRRGLGHLARFAAMTAARRIAAIMLSGLARPRPAMSNPVPWSGEVRTMGSPRVMFTPPQKSSIFTGIRAWS